jgi:hypothetical protein
MSDHGSDHPPSPPAAAGPPRSVGTAGYRSPSRGRNFRRRWGQSLRNPHNPQGTGTAAMAESSLGRHLKSHQYPRLCQFPPLGESPWMAYGSALFALCRLLPTQPLAHVPVAGHHPASTWRRKASRFPAQHGPRDPRLPPQKQGAWLSRYGDREGRTPGRRRPQLP